MIENDEARVTPKRQVDGSLDKAARVTRARRANRTFPSAISAAVASWHRGQKSQLLNEI